MRAWRSILTTVLVLGSGIGTALAQGAEKVSVRLDWTPWGVHAPFHLAAAERLVQGGGPRRPGRGWQRLGDDGPDRRAGTLRCRPCEPCADDDRARQGAAGPRHRQLRAQERRGPAGAPGQRHHLAEAACRQEARLHRRLAGSAVPRRVPGRGRPQAGPARAAERRSRGEDVDLSGGTRRRRVLHRAFRPADRRGGPSRGCHPLCRLRA